MLHTSFVQSEGSFYRGYRLTSYQHAMLMHLMSEEKPKYTIIPDWENLFVVTLLYAQMISVKYEKVMVHSKWEAAIVEEVLRDIPDFYSLYEEVISSKVHIVTQVRHATETSFTIGMGIEEKVSDLTLTLLRHSKDFDSVHRTYVAEQTQPVWVITDSPGYEMTEKSLFVRKPLPRSVIQKQRYFVIDRAWESSYALYATLTRLGDGEKMLLNYFSHPTDSGSGAGYNPGDYFLPLRFYLQIPSWLRLKNFQSADLSTGLTYFELMLLSHYFDLPKSKHENIHDYVEKTCGRFSLKLAHHPWLSYKAPRSDSTRYWAYIDPRLKLCDLLQVSHNLARISPEEEERLRRRKGIR